MVPKNSKLFRGNIPKPKAIPTPSLLLNKALNGGLLEGRIHTFWGAKASGKTTTAMHVVAEAQKMGKICVWVDAEKTYDAEWARACGVDIHELLVLQANSVEEILREVVPLLKAGEVHLVVIDSLSSIFLESYFADPESNPMGGQARATNFLLGKLLDSLNLDSTVILVAHTTMKAVAGGKMGFVSAAKLSNSAEHWTSTIIKFSKLHNDTRDDGSFRVKWKVEKSKQSMYPQDNSYFFKALQDPEDGVVIEYDNLEELVRTAIDEQIFGVSGSWLTWDGVLEKKIQGAGQMTELIRSDESLFKKLLEEINELQPA